MNGYDLILITRHSPTSIIYNIRDLMDYEKSAEFDRKHKKTDGVTTESAARYNIIKYAGDKGKWKIDYKFIIDKNNKFTVVLETVYPGIYHILSTNLKTNIIRSSQIQPLATFIKKAEKQQIQKSRIDMYNEILCHSIANNMFLSVKPSIDELKVRSAATDPKYMRNNIYLNMMSQYKKLYTNKINNLYKFNELIHDESFYQIFSNVVMNEFTNHLIKNLNTLDIENINVAEVYSSFLPTLTRYSRDFRRNMHDKFTASYASMDKQIFSMNDKDREIKLSSIFSETLRMILEGIVTNNSNLFQSLLYKIMLFRLSIIG